MSEGAFHPEDRARSSIDRQLIVCGWVVQSRSEMNLGAGRGVAVREFQTASGPVDYALFVARKLCGVIEAKAEGTTLSGFSDQAERYIHDMPANLVRDEGQVRFEYVASGTEMLFRSCGSRPSSHRVFAFHRPETLEFWLREPQTLRTRLRHILEAIDPDALAAHVPKDAREQEQKRAREAIKEKAAILFDDPKLRTLLKGVKAATDIRIDTVSVDAVVSSGWDERKAGDTVARFKKFLEEKRDELVAPADPLS